MASCASASCSSPSTRPPLPLGPPGGQGRRDRSQRHRVPARGARRLPLPDDARADRPRLLLHRGWVREGLPRARLGAPQDTPLHPAHQRDGRALQRPGPARGAGYHGRQPWRSRAPAGGLQLGLQCSSAACPGRALARGGRPGAPGAGPGPYQSRLPSTVRSVQLAQGHAGHRTRQGRLAARQARRGGSLAQSSGR
jgi:hypothetical protein